MDGCKSIFSVKSFYSFLGKERAKVIPMRVICNLMVLTKVEFYIYIHTHIWEACWETILTLDQLQRRGGLWWVNKYRMQIAIIIANEALDSRLKSSRRGVLCKLDIKKAYGHVNWEFLLVVFKKMGFGQKWIGLIQWCISNTRFSVLLNGTS